MNTSPNIHAMQPALRVYLTYTLHETEALLRRCTFRAETVSSALSLASAKPWLDVVEAARRVIRYVVNCQHDDNLHGGFFARGCFGLCAIEAAQDALHQLLVRARTNSQAYGYERSLVRPDHTVRAKSVNNAIVAMNQKDEELSALWMQAAQYAGSSSSNDKLTTFVSSIASCLEDAAALESNTKHATDGAVNEIRLLAVRYQRITAARSVGSPADVQHSASSAAQLYRKAYEYQCELQEQSCPESKQLLQRAVSVLRQAGDTHATQDAGAQPIREALDAGVRLAGEAKRAVDLLAEQEKLAAACDEVVNEASNSKNPLLLSLWKALSVELDKQHGAFEIYMQMFVKGEGQSRAALELKGQCSVSRVTEMTGSVRKVQACLHSAEYFKKEAAASLNKPSLQQPVLLNRCWTIAATHMDKIIQTCSEAILVDGDFCLRNPRLLPRQKVRADAVTKAISTVEDILSRAAGHLHAAHTAESRGRDPREVEYWRSAAQCLVEIAEKSCTAIEQDVDTLMVLSGTVSTPPTTDLMRKESSYATAAEYMRRAFELRGASLSKDNEFKGCDEQMSQLYDLASTLIIDTSAVNYQDTFAVHVKCFLNNLPRTGDICSAKEGLLKRGIACATEMCKAARDATSDRTCANKWRSALEIIRGGLCASGDGRIRSAHASILELAARAHALGEKESTHLCDFAAQRFNAGSNYYSTNADYTSYQYAVAARILAPIGIPQELQDIQNEASVAEEDVHRMITANARAYQLLVQSIHTPARNTVNAQEEYNVKRFGCKAQDAARLLVDHCETQALEHYHPSGRPQHSQTLIDVQGITVMCAMGAAAAPNDPVVTAAWAEAVEHCRVTAQLPPHCKKKRREGVAVAERLFAEAKTLEEELREV